MAAGAALVAFACAVRLASTASAGDDGVAPVVTTAPAVATRPPRVFAVVPRRDPFAMPVTPPFFAAVAKGPVPALPPFPAALKPLPPNAGAGPLPFALPTALRVSATVTGPRPAALVDDGTTTRVIVPGDRIDGARVVRIDAGGVHLDDGSTLAAQIPIPLPSPSRRTP